ncbi:MAG: hypothetical protein J0I14_11060 [Propionibacteriaceae bacterium]|nr:hypothetical protein [Propionibacteriaceae bacterium]
MVSTSEVRITVQFRSELAPFVDGLGAPAAIGTLLGRLRQLHAVVEPGFPGSNDPGLATWFVVRVPAQNSAEVLAQLQQDPGVTAAYIKPSDAPA